MFTVPILINCPLTACLLAVTVHFQNLYLHFSLFAFTDSSTLPYFILTQKAHFGFGLLPTINNFIQGNVGSNSAFLWMPTLNHQQIARLHVIRFSY